MSSRAPAMASVLTLPGANRHLPPATGGMFRLGQRRPIHRRGLHYRPTSTHTFMHVHPTAVGFNVTSFLWVFCISGFARLL